MLCFCSSNIWLYNDLNCSCKCSFQLDPVWRRWEALRVGVAGKMDGGSGRGESHPAAVTAWLYGDKMPPAYWQEWLPSENTFPVTSSARGRSLWRQNHKSCTMICCLYTVFLSPGKPTHHEVSLPSTQHSLLLLHLPSFLVSTHGTSQGCTATQMGAHTWLLNIHGSVVCRFLCLWLLGTGKFQNGSDSVCLEKVLRCTVLPAIPAVAVLSAGSVCCFSNCWHAASLSSVPVRVIHWPMMNPPGTALLSLLVFGHK